MERLPERRTELWREYLQEWSTDYEGDFEWWLVKKIQVSEAQLAACQQDLEEKDAENERLRNRLEECDQEVATLEGPQDDAHDE